MSDDPRRGNTGVAIETLKEIGAKITAAPQGFHLHRTIQRFLEARRKMIEIRRRDRLVDGGGAGVLRRSSSTATGSGCPARTASAAPSRSAIRC